MLESLHPGRIDLGLGRAPGTDQLTARALRGTARLSDGEDFPQQLAELVALPRGRRSPTDHPVLQGRGPVPHAAGSGPTSGCSARAASAPSWPGMLGLPFSFAHHFSAGNTGPALELYRRSFRPSETLDEPYAMIGVSVRVRRHGRARPVARRAPGPHHAADAHRSARTPGRPPQEAAEYNYTPAEKELLRSITGSHVVGSPETVRDELVELADRTGVQELMVTTNVGDADERLHSYELVARLAAGLTDSTA